MWIILASSPCLSATSHFNRVKPGCHHLPSIYLIAQFQLYVCSGSRMVNLIWGYFSTLSFNPSPEVFFFSPNLFFFFQFSKSLFYSWMVPFIMDWYFFFPLPKDINYSLQNSFCFQDYLCFFLQFLLLLLLLILAFICFSWRLSSNIWSLAV